MFTSIDKAIVAAIMAVLMMLQHAGIGLPEFMTEEWAESLAAFLTPVLVWFWPNKPRPEKAPSATPKSFPILLAGVLCLAMVGCSGTREAYRAADGIDQTAKVVAEHYYATVRELNALDDAGALSPSAKAHAQDLVRQAQPLLSELASAAQAYEAVRSAENEVELEAAINRAAIAISRLIDVFKAAGSGEAWLRSLPAPVAA